DSRLRRRLARTRFGQEELREVDAAHADELGVARRPAPLLRRKLFLLEILRSEVVGTLALGLRPARHGLGHVLALATKPEVRKSLFPPRGLLVLVAPFHRRLRNPPRLLHRETMLFRRVGEVLNVERDRDLVRLPGEAQRLRELRRVGLINEDAMARIL